MAARLRLWLPVTSVLDPRRCRWGCTPPSHTRTGGSGSRARSDGWSYRTLPERKTKTISVRKSNKESSRPIRNLLLRLHFTAIIYHCGVGADLFGGAAQWLRPWSWTGVHLRPRRQKVPNPRAAERLRWRSRPSPRSVTLDDWQTFWSDLKWGRGTKMRFRKYFYNPIWVLVQKKKRKKIKSQFGCGWIKKIKNK